MYYKSSTKVFPGGGRRREENHRLPSRMREILRTAQDEKGPGAEEE